MKKTVKKSQPKNEYTTTLNVLGKTYTAKGKTIAEALLNLKPGIVRGRGILTVQLGDLKKERVLMPMVAYRLFSSRGMTQEVAIKNASMLFGI